MSDMAFPGQTVGALMVGGIVGATLYGLTFSQAFRYHNREQKDSFLMRTYVLALWLADTVNVFLMGHVLYYTFVTRYGDPTVFLAPLWSLVSMVLLTSIVSFMVRGVYIKGIWHLSHEHPVIAGVIAVLSVFDFVCGILLTLKGYGVNRGDFDSLKVYLCLAFASAIIADLSVAGTLWYLLRGSKARTSRHETIIGRLVLYTVNTGFLAAADATIALATYAAMPHKLVFLTPFMVLSHLYTNALFASLNSRTLGESADHLVSLNVSTVSAPRFPGSSVATGPHGSRQRNLAIQSVVHTRVEGPGSDNEDFKSQYSLARAL